VSSILRIYRNFQGLLDYSERDTLTGLLNRKTFDDSFLRIIAQLHAAAQPPQALVDRRQHGAGRRPGQGLAGGDRHRPLQAVNDTLRPPHRRRGAAAAVAPDARQLPLHDQLYRFGGEEFVVLLRCGSEATRWRPSSASRQRAALRLPAGGPHHGEHRLHRLRAGDTPSAAFERADKAVYWAKQNGRNRVAYHADLVARACSLRPPPRTATPSCSSADLAAGGPAFGQQGQIGVNQTFDWLHYSARHASPRA
jgi:GGDEF domain-containing protein